MIPDEPYMHRGLGNDERNSGLLNLVDLAEPLEIPHVGLLRWEE